VNSPSDSNSLWFGPNSYAQSTDSCVNVHCPSTQVASLSNGGAGQTTVSFTFHVIGHGNWQIDDFYVDPIKSQ
jgi:hypothetical protein